MEMAGPRKTEEMPANDAHDANLLACYLNSRRRWAAAEASSQPPWSASVVYPADRHVGQMLYQSAIARLQSDHSEDSSRPKNAAWHRGLAPYLSER